MKKLFAISAVSLLVTVGAAAPASADQMTRQGCKDNGGTWTQIVGVFGKCVIEKRVGAGSGGPKSITADRCKELGGEMSEGKCVIMTKNIANTPPPPKFE